MTFIPTIIKSIMCEKFCVSGNEQLAETAMSFRSQTGLRDSFRREYRVTVCTNGIFLLFIYILSLSIYICSLLARYTLHACEIYLFVRNNFDSTLTRKKETLMHSFLRLIYNFLARFYSKHFCEFSKFTRERERGKKKENLLHRLS